MARINIDQINGNYDLILIGSGFGSLFFLHGYLNKRPNDKILILEWGEIRDREWQLENMKNSHLIDQDAHIAKGEKYWHYTLGYGGGSNCWWGETPRFHPNDFKINSLYGVGNDWPFSYDELEPYYGHAECLMSISGPNDNAVIFPRSTPYPQQEHRMTAVDRMMKEAQPDLHFALPTARSRIATEKRNSCCVSSRCNFCPVGAKFMGVHDFDHLLEMKNIDIAPNCKVTRLDKVGNIIKAVEFEHKNKTYNVQGDLVVLGANAIHSPYILLNSSIDHPYTGVGIHEQMSVYVEAFLDGLDNFDGSTTSTSFNYSLYDGDFRSQYSGARISFRNEYRRGLRKEYGRWRQIAPMAVVVEDLPLDYNKVVVGAGGKPEVLHKGYSDYALEGMKQALKKLPDVLSPLPVEKIVAAEPRNTEYHIIGSLRMGNDPKKSVVDSNMMHHSIKNLVVVGSSVFPSSSCANPSLTIAALSLRSADKLL